MMHIVFHLLVSYGIALMVYFAIGSLLATIVLYNWGNNHGHAFGRFGKGNLNRIGATFAAGGMTLFWPLAIPFVLPVLLYSRLMRPPPPPQAEPVQNLCDSCLKELEPAKIPESSTTSLSTSLPTPVERHYVENVALYDEFGRPLPSDYYARRDPRPRFR